MSTDEQAQYDAEAWEAGYIRGIQAAEAAFGAMLYTDNNIDLNTTPGELYYRFGERPKAAYCRVKRGSMNTALISCAVCRKGYTVQLREGQAITQFWHNSQPYGEPPEHPIRVVDATGKTLLKYSLRDTATDCTMLATTMGFPPQVDRMLNS